MSFNSAFASIDKEGTSSAEKLYLLINKNSEMRASFTQTIISSSGSEQRSNGSLWLKKPNYFKWQVNSPSQLIVSNGYKLWNYNKDLEQVTIQPVPKQISQAPYLLLLAGNLSALKSLFNIKEIGHGYFYLTPKDTKDSVIEYINIYFKQDRLTGLKIKTVMNQISILPFTNQTYAKIAPNQFEFTIPQGVDVLGG
jgi:outer membrane lipoprotein carrier protein